MQTAEYQRIRADFIAANTSDARSDPGVPYMIPRQRDITLCNYDEQLENNRERGVTFISHNDVPRTAVEGWKNDTPWVRPDDYEFGGRVQYETPLTCHKGTSARRRALALINRRNLPSTAATGWAVNVNSNNTQWNSTSRNRCGTRHLYGAAKWR